MAAQEKKWKTEVCPSRERKWFQSVVVLVACFCVLQIQRGSLLAVEANTFIENETEFITMSDRNESSAPMSKISVQGQGNVGVKPDLVSIQIGVNMERDTAAEALRDNNEIMARVSGKVVDLGVEERDVMTSSVSLNPVYNYIRNKETNTNKRVLSGFSASNSMTLRIRKLDSVGDVLGVLVEAGVNSIDSIRFTAEDTLEAADEARTAAVLDAKRKADVLAAAAGYRVASIIEMSSYDNNPAPSVQKGGNARMLMATMEDSVGSVPIAGGELTVSSSVSIVYKIESVA